MSQRLILQLFRGTAAQNDAYLGQAGEVTVDTTHRRLRLHDGVNAGGTVISNLDDGMSPADVTALINTGLVVKAEAGGDAEQDFAVKVLHVNGNILPGAEDLDIGSPTNRFRAIYVDEAYLSTNTLYIGDTPIMGTENDTILIKADLDQSITIRTTGQGTTTLVSGKGVNVSTTGPNADIQMVASGSGSKVRFTAQNDIELIGRAIKVDGDTSFLDPVQFGSNVTVNGNITINGTTTTVNSETTQVADNIIVLNNGEPGSGVTKGTAGIEVDRGNLSSYQFVFDEVEDMFKVGMVGDLEIVSTRPWVEEFFSSVNHGHTAATSAASGFMSAADKAKLDGIEAGATATRELTKVEVDDLGVDAATVGGFTVGKSVPANAVFTDTVYNDTQLRNSVGAVETALESKVDKVNGKGLSTEDFTTAYKNVLNNAHDASNLTEGTLPNARINMASLLGPLGFSHDPITQRWGIDAGLLP